MTGRDRMVVIGVVVLAILGGAWVMVVSPKRKEAGKLNTQVAEAQTQLASAEGQLSSARAAQAEYAAAYTSIVSLGKAVPASQEVPSLIYQLSQATNKKKVDFTSIASITSGGAAGGAPSSTAASAAFTQMPFTFVFGGRFFELEHLFQQLNGFTVRQASGGLVVSGRLLTIQSVKLAPENSAGAAGHASGSQSLAGTVTASAYVLPAAQGLTGGATASSPAGATTPSNPTTGSSGSPSAPAIARVTP
ncbi:MAG: hypothetical protein JWL67_2159 [Solirubrobacterales bacterium]|jgi:hypothetical protein|nr:hypothetical protein [Solirubrobacterales bacterium]